MVSVGINVHIPDELVLLVTELAAVDDVVVLVVDELVLLLLLDGDPPPQLINPVAPIRLNTPSAPSVLRRSLSITE